jgi:hypothetical protein
MEIDGDWARCWFLEIMILVRGRLLEIRKDTGKRD